MMSLVSSQDTIRQLIPQRPPMVLVDQLFEHDETTIVAGFDIPQGHLLVDAAGFLTEAGIMEHFAQTVALYDGYDHFKRNLPTPVGYIGSIKNFEIYAKPRAGHSLRTTIRIIQQLFGVTAVLGEVKRNDQLVASGEMRTVTAKDLG